MDGLGLTSTDDIMDILAGAVIIIVLLFCLGIVLVALALFSIVMPLRR